MKPTRMNIDGNDIALRQRAPVRRVRPWLTLAVVLLLIALAANTVLLLKYRSAVKSNPVSQQQELVRAVGQAVLTPAETPVISTVADKAKLTNSALAGQVQNGDKILVYGKARRLIVYRPSVHKVVTMLNIQTDSAQP